MVDQRLDTQDEFDEGSVGACVSSPENRTVLELDKRSNFKLLKMKKNKIYH